MILRGFDLFWYRKSDSKEAKAVFELPSKQLKDMKTPDGKEFFLLDIDRKTKLGFLDDYLGHSWKLLLNNQIAFKSYYDHCNIY